jgi:hypothetical protein
MPSCVACSEDTNPRKVVYFASGPGLRNVVLYPEITLSILRFPRIIALALLRLVEITFGLSAAIPYIAVLVSFHFCIPRLEKLHGDFPHSCFFYPASVSQSSQSHQDVQREKPTFTHSENFL